MATSLPRQKANRTWRAAFAVDWRKQDLGALNVEVFHEWRSDVLDQVILPSSAFGLGNAGDGRVWGTSLSGSVQLEPLIPGGLLELEAELRESSFDDAVINSSRNLTDITSPSISLDFRQDLTAAKLSWGLGYIPYEDTDSYFVDKISASREGSQWTAFIETTRWANMKTTLTLRGLGEQNFRNKRRFFSPDRSGPITGSEISKRDHGLFINLTLESQY